MGNSFNYRGLIDRLLEIAEVVTFLSSRNEKNDRTMRRLMRETPCSRILRINGPFSLIYWLGT